jgi:hypothetical protein
MSFKSVLDDVHCFTTSSHDLPIWCLPLLHIIPGFLNSSVSFVVTDLIKARDGVGDAVGTLGFADELVALAACPAWGCCQIELSQDCKLPRHRVQ